MSIDSSVVPFGLRALNMCVCASINPGNTVDWVRSITCAPVGIFTCASGPTSAMRSPLVTITCRVSIRPVLVSSRRPARMALMPGDPAHV